MSSVLRKRSSRKVSAMASRPGTSPSCSPLRERGRRAEYFRLETNRRVEFSHGFLEFLPMPTVSHQRIAAFLYDALRCVRPRT